MNTALQERPGVFAAVEGLISAGLALVYPDVCELCRQNRAGPKEGYVCSVCRLEVKAINPPFCDRCGLPFKGDISQIFTCSQCRSSQPAFTKARAAVEAKGKLLEAIHRYKYQGGVWFEPFLAGLLVARAAPELAGQNWDAIVPVPLYPAKERERGFNQAERLARPLSRETGIPLETRTIRRRLPTPTQTRLSKEERRKNVSQAFSVGSPKRTAGKRIVLVDDVFTTGATTDACATALLRAGAAEVCVWTLARGI